MVDRFERTEWWRVPTSQLRSGISLLDPFCGCLGALFRRAEQKHPSLFTLGEFHKARQQVGTVILSFSGVPITRDAHTSGIPSASTSSQRWSTSINSSSSMEFIRKSTLAVATW